MRKKIAAAVLSVLLAFQMLVPSAGADPYICFVAAGESILPLSVTEMPFWKDGNLYISSEIFTGIGRKALDIGRVRNDERKLVILHSGDRSLMFEWNKSYAQDTDGNTYYPGAIYRKGNVYVPAAVVAKFFGLQCTVTKFSSTMDGKPVNGDLAWIRPPGHILTDKLFANAATSQILSRYREYLKEKAEYDAKNPGVPDGVEIEGKRIYLCLAADENTETMLDVLERYDVQAAFFCTPEFMEEQGALLRRMTATGQSIGILIRTEDAERTAAQQLEAGNAALERATWGKTRLVLAQGDGESPESLRELGYRCLEPDVDRMGYHLRSTANASSLLQRVSDHRGDVTVWLGSTADTTGLQAFLSIAETADGRCLAWTETA